MGEDPEGLYYFRSMEGMLSVKTLKTAWTNSFNIWHQRLGHPSDKVLGFLPTIDKNGDSSVRCEVCFQAKQSRTEFVSSKNKASTIFEIIHCDLWGPYKTPTFCDAFYFLTIVDDY